MARVTSNYDEIAALLDEIVRGFDFQVPGAEGSLGRDLVGLVAQGIYDRSVPGARAPGGSTWEANEPKYASRKLRRFQAAQPGLRTGKMLSLDSLKGRPQIAPDHVEMVYGTGDPPGQSSRSGAEVKPYERQVADDVYARYFSERRPFYELDPDIDATLIEASGKALDEYLGQFGV